MRANRLRSVSEKKLFRLLAVDDAQVQDLTAEQLDALWAPSFHFIDRWGCFMSAPYVLFLCNGIFTICVTVLFTWWFVWMRLTPGLRTTEHNPSPEYLADLRALVVPGMAPTQLSIYQITRVEVFLCVYFACSMLRESSQLFVSVLQHGQLAGFLEYVLDIWNLIDVFSPITFMWGLHYRNMCVADTSTCYASMDLTAERPVESWSLAYGVSVFFCWCRVLRIFYMSEAGVVVSIFFRMFKDVFYFLVVYIILLVAIAMLFLGASDLESLVPGWQTCENGTKTLNSTGVAGVPDTGFLTCSRAYIFIRPMFQSFGEFFLPEMKNAPSLVFLILNFFLLNLILMNLLIAMMASTYEKVSQRANSQLLLYTYSLLEEHSRRAIGAPVPLNVVLLIYEAIRYCWDYRLVKDTYPDCTWGKRLDLFLARNHTFQHDTHKHRQNKEDGTQTKEGGRNSSQEKGSFGDDMDQKCQAQLSAFMERARSVVVNKVHPKESLDGKVDLIAADIRHMQLMQEGMRVQGMARGGGGVGGTESIFERQARARTQERRVESANKLREVGRRVGKMKMVANGFRNEDLLPGKFFHERDKYSAENEVRHIPEETAAAKAEAEARNTEVLLLRKDLEQAVRESEASRAQVHVYQTINSKLLTMLYPTHTGARTLMDPFHPASALASIAWSEPSSFESRGFESALDAVKSQLAYADRGSQRL